MLTGSTILGAGASSGYAADPAMMRNATSAPKEIGYLQRIEGLSAGLAEIDGRLMAFAGRLTGQGRTEGGPEPAPIGLEGVLAQAEQRVRAILQTLGHINDAF